MFATIIQDAYKKEEATKIAEALDDLCNPNDNYGWSSAGIYCFWDYYTKEVYYIGLAVDLTERFKQHNDLIPSFSGTKKAFINEYFKQKEILGFTIFVQSVMSQPFIKRKNSGFVFQNTEDRDDLKKVEGILIEAYKKKHGIFPKWNKIGGSIKGQISAKMGNYEIIEGFTTNEFHPLVSRSSLRELSENVTYERFEEVFLHVVRFAMLYFGLNFNDAISYAQSTDNFDYFDRIYKMNYLSKNLNLSPSKA